MPRHDRLFRRWRPPGAATRRRARPGAALLWLAGALLAGSFLLPVLGDGAVALGGARGPEGCRVVRVVDGDTVTLWCPAEGFARLRLTGYDAPEVFSPGCPSEFVQGVTATWALRLLLLRGGQMEVGERGADRFGRTLAEVRIDGAPVAGQLVAMGQARRYDGGRRQGWCGPS